MADRIADVYLACESREEAQPLIKRAQKYAEKNGYTIGGTYYCNKDTPPGLLDKVIASLPERKVGLLILSDRNALGNDEMIRRERRINIFKADTKIIYLKAGQKQSYELYWLNIIKDYNSYALDWKIRIGVMDRPSPHKITNGSRPYGYDSENGYYAVNEKQAEDVRFIFDLYDSGLNASAIAERLNKRENGHRFPVSSIMSILQNEHYAGTDRGEAGMVPAIISNGQFLRVKGRIEKNRKDGPAAYPFLFDNVYFTVGRTKIKLRPANRNGKHGKPVYCGNHNGSLLCADAGKLENSVINGLTEIIYKGVDAGCSKILSFTEVKKAEMLQYIEKTEKEKEILKSEFNTIFGVNPETQNITRESIAKFDELKAALDEINKKLHRAEIISELCSQNKNDICDFFMNMKRLPDMHPCEAKFFMNRLISEIRLNESGITVGFNYSEGKKIKFSDPQILSVKPLKGANSDTKPEIR